MAAQADTLLNSEAWKLAYFNVRKQYFNSLLAAKVGDPEVLRVHSMLKALEDIVGELKAFINEEKVQQTRDKKRV